MPIGIEEQRALVIHEGSYARMLLEWLVRPEVDDEVLEVREEQGPNGPNYEILPNGRLVCPACHRNYLPTTIRRNCIAIDLRYGL